MDLQLEGLSIVVTGGSSGIGLATVGHLLAEGANVTICARDRGRLGDVETELNSPAVLTLAIDVLDPAQTSSVIPAVAKRWGRLDGVAAIAGHGRFGSFLELDPSDAVQEVADKLAGFLNIVRPAIPALVETSGRIVGVTTPASAHPDANMGAIGAGRAALDNAMRGLADELAPRGVRVNAVGVGLIDTPRQQARHAESGTDVAYHDWLAQQARLRSVPLGRPGTAAEVAAAVCWLLSPISSYTTGAVIDVTGGHSTR